MPTLSLVLVPYQEARDVLVNCRANHCPMLSMWLDDLSTPSRLRFSEGSPQAPGLAALDLASKHITTSSAARPGVWGEPPGESSRDPFLSMCIYQRALLLRRDGRKAHGSVHNIMCHFYSSSWHLEQVIYLFSRDEDLCPVIIEPVLPSAT